EKRIKTSTNIGRRLQVVMVVSMLLSLIAGWTLLASPRARDRGFKHEIDKNTPLEVQSLNAKPSKEYIYAGYAGGRLLATEEPQASTIGVYDPMGQYFYLRNANSSGIADFSFAYGPS